MPSHKHTGTATSGGSHTHTMSLKAYARNLSTENHGWGNDDVARGPYTNTTNSGGAHTHSLTINNTGSGKAHNIIQPYYTCYIWKRVS